MFKLKYSFSSILIVLSIIITTIAMIENKLYTLGINSFFLDAWKYYIFILQIFIGTFLHWGVIHLLMNSIFIHIFWNIVEIIMWRNKYIIFFLFSIIFNAIAIILFTEGNTVWISGFAMALITYYTFELKSKNNPEYKWWFIAIILNLGIWFSPGISLIWHLFWAIWWGLFYLYNKKIGMKQ